MEKLSARIYSDGRFVGSRMGERNFHLVDTVTGNTVAKVKTVREMKSIARQRNEALHGKTFTSFADLFRACK